MTHELKTWTQFFDDIERGNKTFEIRKNDRGFSVGDILNLREWDAHDQLYTGLEIKVRVTYLTDFEQKDGFVVMAIILIPEGSL